MSWTLDDLDPATTLVTVNNRLAAELRRRFDRDRAAAGQRVWPSADILPWQAWLARQYEQLLDLGFTRLDLLTPAQERLLWQEVIERDPAAAALLRPGAAAEAARGSFALLHAWQLDGAALDLSGSDETRTFLAWRKAFDRVLARRGLLSAATLPTLVSEALAQGVLTPPARLVHSGFDQPAPAQLRLLAALSGAGCVVEAHVEPCRGGSRARVELADAESELRCAALWTRRWLEQAPGARIGIVAPQIARQRRDIERVFGEVLEPAAYLGLERRPGLFDISLGTPLAECPLVAHALLGLELLLGPQPLGAIGQILRSPFVGGHATEWEARALLDAGLREDGMPRIDLGRLRARLARLDPSGPGHCPDLGARLARLAELQQSLPRSAPPERWAALLQQLLNCLGWPGDQGLDSREFQQHARLQRVFSELAALGKVRPRMRLAEAVGQLRALATEAVFQAEAGPVPVRILGPLEAAGMQFDALWLLSMHDQNWPPAPHPDPLLPVGLQRELGMPHASAARELAFAAAITARLADGAGQVVASHARFDGEREQRVSPLLLDWPLQATEALVAAEHGALRAACVEAGAREPLPAASASRAAPLQRGGAALLAAQANCPFQAVARFRLAAEPLAEPSFSADARLLGNLVHELLQRVWQRLGDSATLHRHDEASLGELIAPLAQATLDDLGRQRPDLFTARFRALELDRLQRLLLDWLAVERQRGQGFRVESLERAQTVEVEGLQLKTRADRVDRLEDGSLAIIDYKTGREVSSTGWFDERLSEPQLPLYCLADDAQVGAALLARVRRDGKGCGFVGLSRAPGFAPGVETPQHDGVELAWTELLGWWRGALGRLARELISGRADPTPSPAACRYCRQGPLCRVQEMLEDADD
jgi:probable DNA repair protein